MGYGQYSDSPKVSKPAVPASKEKTKRLKHVFDNPTHVWATPRQKDGSGFEQDNARNPQGNIYFKTDEDGTRVLYSYRDSYPIASRIVQNKKPIYLLRSGKPYSVTTAKHFNMAASAVRGAVRVFHVPYVTSYNLESGYYGESSARTGKPDKATHAANVKDYETRIVETIGEYSRVRSAWQIQNKHTLAVSLIAEIKSYCTFFAIKLPKLPKMPVLDMGRIAKAKASESYRDAHAAELQVKREAERAKAFAEQIAKWKRGEVSGRFHFGRLSFLRVVRDAETGMHNVETTQGVSVPVLGSTGAARLLRFLQALKSENRTYRANGHTEHIGQFTVSSFDGETLIAGCHTIQWAEVESVADAVRNAAEADNLHGIAFA